MSCCRFCLARAEIVLCFWCLDAAACLCSSVRFHSLLLQIEISGFDARAKFGAICPSLLHVRDQARCGSCWAHAATESYNDRMCIATNARKGTSLLSVEHTTSCCGLWPCLSKGDSRLYARPSLLVYRKKRSKVRPSSYRKSRDGSIPLTWLLQILQFFV